MEAHLAHSLNMSLSVSGWLSSWATEDREGYFCKCLDHSNEGRALPGQTHPPLLTPDKIAGVTVLKIDRDYLREGGRKEGEGEGERERGREGERERGREGEREGGREGGRGREGGHGERPSGRVQSLYPS